MVKIEKGIPLPSGRRGHNSRYATLDTMQVGDSFRIEAREDVTAWKSAANNFGAKYGKKFSVRAFEDAHRCWRVE